MVPQPRHREPVGHRWRLLPVLRSDEPRADHRRPGTARGRRVRPGAARSRLSRARSRSCGRITCSKGRSLPSRRENSSSAAARPSAYGSWATTVRPGSSTSLSGMSSKPTCATVCLHGELVKRAKCADREQVLGAEDRARRVRSEQQRPCCLVRGSGIVEVGADESEGTAMAWSRSASRSHSVAQWRCGSARGRRGTRFVGGRWRAGARRRGGRHRALSVRTVSLSSNRGGRSRKTSGIPAARSRSK